MVRAVCGTMAVRPDKGGKRGGKAYLTHVGDEIPETRTAVRVVGGRSDLRGEGVGLFAVVGALLEAVEHAVGRHVVLFGSNMAWRGLSRGWRRKGREERREEGPFVDHVGSCVEPIRRRVKRLWLEHWKGGDARKTSRLARIRRRQPQGKGGS